MALMQPSKLSYYDADMYGGKYYISCADTDPPIVYDDHSRGGRRTTIVGAWCEGRTGGRIWLRVTVDGRVGVLLVNADLLQEALATGDAVWV